MSPKIHSFLYVLTFWASRGYNPCSTYAFRFTVVLVFSINSYISHHFPHQPGQYTSGLWLRSRPFVPVSRWGHVDNGTQAILGLHSWHLQFIHTSYFSCPFSYMSQGYAIQLPEVFRLPGFKWPFQEYHRIRELEETSKVISAHSRIPSTTLLTAMITDLQGSLFQQIAFL